MENVGILRKAHAFPKSHVLPSATHGPPRAGQWCHPPDRFSRELRAVDPPGHRQADTGSIVPPNFQGEGRILIGILSPSLVFHEFAGTMPGRSP